MNHNTAAGGPEPPTAKATRPNDGDFFFGVAHDVQALEALVLAGPMPRESERVG